MPPGCDFGTRAKNNSKTGHARCWRWWFECEWNSEEKRFRYCSYNTWIVDSFQRNLICPGLRTNHTAALNLMSPLSCLTYFTVALKKAFCGEARSLWKCPCLDFNSIYYWLSKGLLFSGHQTLVSRSRASGHLEVYTSHESNTLIKISVLVSLHLLTLLLCLSLLYGCCVLSPGCVFYFDNCEYLSVKTVTDYS